MNGEVFAVIYHPGPAWEATLPFQSQRDVHKHRDFLIERQRDGTLVVGGPFLDNAGGLAIYQSASQQELESVLNEDATVAAGLLQYEVHPYVMALRGKVDSCS